MRVLYLTDRLSLRGGADHHLLQVMSSMRSLGFEVAVGYGRLDRGASTLPGVDGVRVKGLASVVSRDAGLGALPRLLAGADLVHVQNVMNPVALEMATATGRAVVTVQDHRVFCPGLGKTLPDGRRCRSPMSPTECAACVPDDAYLARTLRLTADRRRALGDARLIVLSRYMADELEAAGLRRAEVIPPWIEVGAARAEPGRGFVIGGRLVPHKAPLDGWRAWRLAATSHPLEIAGEGPLEGELVGSRRQGWLPQKALARVLRGARALIFPGFWQEPFGILAVQALAEGTPVIVAALGGTSEWSGEGCVVVPAGDVSAMAEAIVRLADDPEGALELGRAGRSAVARCFSRATIEPRLRALYDEVAHVPR